MTTDDRIDRHRGPISGLLVALGVPQAAIGLWALLAPHSFYGDFPGAGASGWVSKLGPYDEHLVRDAGSLFLGLGVLMILAAAFARRRLVLVALLSWLLFAVPHAIYHVLNLGPYGTGDAIANMATIAWTVIAPLIVLALLRRPAVAVGGPPGAAASDDGASARLAKRPARGAGPIVRYAYRTSRKQMGKVVTPIAVTAHHPTLLAGYGAFELATERSHRVERRLKDLGVLRAAMLAGCEWCLDFGSAEVREMGISDDELRALPSYRESARFSDLDKLVLDYATGMSHTPVEVSDDLFARLREHFDEPQLVELTSVIALENYRARFNWALGIESEGFSDGAYCVRPEGAAPAESVQTPA